MSNAAGWSSATYPTEIRRYRSAARWFHWLTAALMFVIVPLGWIFAEFKRKPDGHFEAPFPGTAADYASAHKTLGLLLLALVLARLAYRVGHRPPTLPRSVSAFEKILSHATHWVIYLVLLVMPISGYIMSSGSKHPISIFGLFDFPKLPVTDDMAKTAVGIHLSVQWAVYALVIAHILGVAWHLFVRRDDLLGRMLPRQAHVE